MKGSADALPFIFEVDADGDPFGDHTREIAFANFA